MKRTILLATLSLGLAQAHAQYASYNHDATKMNQITIMEIGTGSLTPEFYYTLLHNNYKKSAASKNKLGFRTAAGMAAYGQVDKAEQIDSALTSRAKIEALNIADREVDIAWMAEGGKIEEKLQSFQNNINRIVPAGGQPSDRTRWTEYYNMYKTAINATRNAYMPNAQRKKEYLHIYDDLCKQNELLVSFIVSVNNRAKTSHALQATLNRTNRTGEIVNEARMRWHGTSSNSITE